jgi:hypothetical protein
MKVKKFLKQTIACYFIALASSSTAFSSDFQEDSAPRSPLITGRSRSHPIVIASNESSPVKELPAVHHPRAPLMPLGQSPGNSPAKRKIRFESNGQFVAVVASRASTDALSFRDAVAVANHAAPQPMAIDWGSELSSGSGDSEDTIPHVVERAFLPVLPSRAPSIRKPKTLVQKTLFGNRVVHDWKHCQTGSDQLYVGTKVVTVMQSRPPGTSGKFVINVATFENGNRISTTFPISFATQAAARLHVEQNLSNIRAM